MRKTAVCSDLHIVDLKILAQCLSRTRAAQKSTFPRDGKTARGEVTFSVTVKMEREAFIEEMAPHFFGDKKE